LSEKSDRVVVDRDKASIHKSGGVWKQRIPARWKKLSSLQNFFEGDLEINLVQEAGVYFIEIRRVRKLES